MKLYACYTPSHRPLLGRHFLPSLPEHDWPAQFRKSLALKELPQRSSTGAFKSAGFQDTCLDKVDFIIEALKNETEPFLFSDVDVRFYGPVADDLLECLGDADMAFQWDGVRGRECTGFMVIRPSNRSLDFWQSVRNRMADHGMMDQDAAHSELEFDRVNGTAEIRAAVLPERYWTFGRNDKHWTPGMPVNPPADLLVHHANWTVGVENKMKLLEAVRAQAGHQFSVDVSGAAESGRALAGRIAKFNQAEVSGIVQASIADSTERTLPYSEVTRMLEDQRRSLMGTSRHPLPLALVLQFWKGDKRRALDLARLLADLEPFPREDMTDVCLFFARQDGCPMDDEIREAAAYVGQKFPVSHLVTKVDESKKYPGIAFDPWASAVQQLSDAYHTGKLPYANAFFFEADGCPIGTDWIERLKRAHEETLLLGKRITGPLMRFGGVDHVHQVGGHVNGTFAMHLSCWDDHPSIHRCHPRAAWDVFHGLVLRNEAGPSQIIRNEHGASGLSESMYHVIGKESAWLTSIKDSTAHHWCRQYLERTVRR